MKTQYNLYLDLDLIQKLKEKAVNLRTKPSNIVNRLLRESLHVDEELPNKKMITCEKCQSSYSSVLNTCPDCANEDVVKENKKVEEEMENKKRLEDLVKLKENLRLTIAAKRRLEADEPDRVDDIEELNKTIEQIKGELEKGDNDA